MKEIINTMPKKDIFEEKKMNFSKWDKLLFNDQDVNLDNNDINGGGIV